MSKDFLKKYKKSKIISNITIIIISIIIAFAINFLVLDKSNFWNNIKTSILDIKNQQNKADLFFKKNNNQIILKNSKILNNTKSLSFSLIYNPENIEIKSINCNSNNLIKIENTPWIKAIIVNYNNPINITKNTHICKINILKKQIKSEQLNLINSNFTTKTWETFLLTTSGITF